MNSETKVCQNCKQNFTIDPEDFAFYEKIKVPPPTFCPKCRAQRRLLWRNERFLYKRKSDFTSNSIFAAISEQSPMKVYEKDIWYSDKWDPMTYGRNIDFTRPFLNQLYELHISVPKPALFVIYMSNSDYCNNATGAKNSYLVFNTNYPEDCMYGNGIDYSKSCIDNSHIKKCELSYEGFWLTQCNHTFFSSQCEDSHDIYFSKNLRGCDNCFGCVNLRNKRYHIFNQPYSKEDYLKKLKEYDLGSYQILLSLKEKAHDFWLRFPNKFMEGIRNTDVSGEYINQSKNVKNSYLIREGEDLKYCQYLQTPSNKSCYDHSIWGANNSFTYECAICGLGTNSIKFCALCWPEVEDLTYCMFCGSSSNLFGCVGVQKKQYCILNKQYTKEEYEQLVPKIIDQMNQIPYIDNRGIIYSYGEFFPPHFSPFGYNETSAQDHFFMRKEDALVLGYHWKDPEKRDYQISITANQISDHIRETTDSVTNEIIGCVHEGKCNEECTIAFRILPQELEFYKRLNIPLPRLCPHCRHGERIRQRNSFLLSRRICACKGEKSNNALYSNTMNHFHGTDPCPNEFETSYAPDRPEIIYCEQCYNSEVA